MASMMPSLSQAHDSPRHMTLPPASSPLFHCMNIVRGETPEPRVLLARHTVYQTAQ